MLKVELLYAGAKFNIYQTVGTKADVLTVLSDLEQSNPSEHEKAVALLASVAQAGPPFNSQKSRKTSFDGLLELKPGGYRIPYFYHPNLSAVIVLTHMFKKCPPKEQTKELKYADNLRKQL